MKIVVTVSTNKVGSECETEIEVDDNATEEEIEEEAHDAAMQYVEWSWKRLDQ